LKSVSSFDHDGRTVLARVQAGVHRKQRNPSVTVGAKAVSCDNWEWPLALLALAGTILAFALRGASRMEAIAAGFLMFAGLTFTVS